MATGLAVRNLAVEIKGTTTSLRAAHGVLHARLLYLPWTVVLMLLDAGR
jgi:hypothetical protein